MTVTATTITDLATAIATTLDTIAAVQTVFTEEPRDIGTLPAITIDGPYPVTRKGPDEPDSQLGFFDLSTTWIVRIYAARDETPGAMTVARQLLGSVIGTIDGNATLGLPGVVFQASVVTGHRARWHESDGTAVTVGFECELDVLSLIP